MATSQEPGARDEGDAPSPQVDTIAGRYDLRAQLGRGGFGVVYEAWDRLEERKVALKIIRSGIGAGALASRTMDSVQRTPPRAPLTGALTGALTQGLSGPVSAHRGRLTQSFKDEFRLLTQLHHSNLAAVYDFGYSEEVQGVFFTQELVVGTPLDEYLQRAPRERIVDVFVQLSRALDHIHALGLLHEDIKPSNVLVTTTGPSPQAKLIDFGLARMLRGVDEEVEREEGPLLGTPGFSAPERVCGQATDSRSDVYSLAATMYAGIQGACPFSTRSFKEAVVGQLEWTPSRALVLRERAGPVVADVVGRMLEPDPDRRPQSARSLVLEIVRREDIGLGTHDDAHDRSELARLLVEHLPFVDRANMLDRLLERYEALTALAAGEDLPRGTARTIIVTAPSGMGKQRLFSEMRREVQLRGGLFAEASGWTAEQGGGLGPFASVLLQLATAVGAEAAPVREHGALLRLARGETSSQQAVSDAALVDFLLGCAELRPYVLHIAELSAAGEATRRRFDALVRAVEHKKARILLCAHTAPSGRLSRMLAQVQKENLGEGWSLGSFTTDELRALIEAVFGRGPDMPSVVALLNAQTAGHPMGVREALRVLIEEAILAREGDGWVLRGSPARAESLHETLARRTEARLDSVGVGAWELASTLYLIDTPITEEELGQLTDLRQDRFQRLVERLEGEGLVSRSSGSRTPKLKLAHESAREAVRRRYEDALDETRLDLAARIEELDTDESALLFLRAKLLDDASEALENLESIEALTKHLLEAGEPQLAAQLYDRTIRRLRRHGGVSALPRLLQTILDLSLHVRGALENPEGELAHLRAGILLAELLDDPRAEAELWFALVDRYANDVDRDIATGLEQLDRAADAARRCGDRILQLRVANRRAETLVSAGLIDQARQYSLQAMEILDIEGAEDADIVQIVGVRMRCLSFAGQNGEARKLHDFVRPIAARVPVIQRQTYLSGLAFLGLLGGDPQRAIPETEAAVEELRRSGMQLLLITPLHNLADLRLRSGDVEGARKGFEEALRIATLTGRTYHVYLNQGFLGYTMVRLGQVREGAQLLARAKDELQALTGEHVSLNQLRLLDAEVAHVLGHSARARRQLEELLARFYGANELALANWAQDALARIERDVGTSFVDAGAGVEGEEPAAPDEDTVKTQPLDL